MWPTPFVRPLQALRPTGPTSFALLPVQNVIRVQVSPSEGLRTRRNNLGAVLPAAEPGVGALSAATDLQRSLLLSPSNSHYSQESKKRERGGGGYQTQF